MDDGFMLEYEDHSAIKFDKDIAEDSTYVTHIIPFRPIHVPHILPKDPRVIHGHAARELVCTRFPHGAPASNLQRLCVFRYNAL